MNNFIKFADKSLLPCDEYYGEFEIRSNDPECDEVHDFVYTPFQHAGPWGIFTSQGTAHQSAIDRQGPQAALIHQIPELSVAPDHLPWAPDEDYVYAGRFNPHFGHFLVETLPRLWWLVREPIGRRKILMHAGTDFGWMHHFPFACKIWKALGLSADNLVTFGHPVRVKRLTIPHVSLRQQAFAHSVFGELGRLIGDRITAGLGQEPHPRPGYLSKTQLTQAVGRLANESVLENRLAAEGIDIIHPDKLDFAEQVHLFQTRPCILGTAGSAFHTCLFSRQQPRLILLEARAWVNTNFTLIEHLSGSVAEHYYQPGLCDLGPTETVQSYRVLADAEAAARDLLDIMRTAPVRLASKAAGFDDNEAIPSSERHRSPMHRLWACLRRSVPLLSKLRGTSGTPRL